MTKKTTFIWNRKKAKRMAERGKNLGVLILALVMCFYSTPAFSDPPEDFQLRQGPEGNTAPVKPVNLHEAHAYAKMNLQAGPKWGSSIYDGMGQTISGVRSMGFSNHFSFRPFKLPARMGIFQFHPVNLRRQPAENFPNPWWSRNAPQNGRDSWFPPPPKWPHEREQPPEPEEEDDDLRIPEDSRYPESWGDPWPEPYSEDNPKYWCNPMAFVDPENPCPDKSEEYPPESGEIYIAEYCYKRNSDNTWRVEHCMIID